MRLLRSAMTVSATASMLGGIALVNLPASHAATTYALDRTLPSPIVESSGLATSTRVTGLLWTHEDGGRPNKIYAVNPNGTVKSTVTLTGAKNVDWEDIASGPSNSIWVSDTGDNNVTRTSVQVYKLTEPSTLTATMSVTPTKYTLTFPDGAKNVEALLVHPTSGRLYLVSKTAAGTAGAVYEAPATLSTSTANKLTKVGTAPSGVTSGEWAPNGRSFALGTRTQVHVYAGIGTTPNVVPLPTQLKQAESLAISSDSTTMYVGSEGASSPVYRAALPPAATANAAPVAAFSATSTNLTASLDASGSADADGAVVSYVWDFGDGSTGSGTVVSHTYGAAGTKTVKLTVTDDRNATSSMTKSVTVTTPVAPPGALTLSDGSVMNARGIMSADDHGILVGGTYGSNSDPAPWESTSGRNLGVSRKFYTSSQVAGAVANAKFDLEHKRVPWVSFKLPYSWEDMAAGKGDAWTLDLVSKLDALGGPVYLAFHHEPEGDGDIQAWKRMQERLGPIVRGNSDNVAFTVVLTGWNQLYGDAQYRLDNMMPITKVDLLGVDVYEKYGTNNSSGAMITSWTNFDTGYYKPISDWATAHDMAWGVAETAFDDDAYAVKPEWISQNIALARKYDAQAWAYFNTGLNNLASGSAWALETAGEQAAFKAGITGTASLR